MLNSLSRGAPSTTRPPLRCGVIMSMRFCLQGVFRILPIFLSLYILQVIAA